MVVVPPHGNFVWEKNSSHQMLAQNGKQGGDAHKPKPYKNKKLRTRQITIMLVN